MVQIHIVYYDNIVVDPVILYSLKFLRLKNFVDFGGLSMAMKISPVTH